MSRTEPVKDHLHDPDPPCWRCPPNGLAIAFRNPNIPTVAFWRPFSEIMRSFRLDSRWAVLDAPLTNAGLHKRLSRLEREVFKVVVSLMWQVVTQALVY